jgi:hypothetical protein
MSGRRSTPAGHGDRVPTDTSDRVPLPAASARPAGGVADEPLTNARLAGLLYLVIIVCGLFTQLAVRNRLTGTGDPAVTAGRILDAEWLVRAGAVASLAYLLCEVVLTVILYRLLRPVSQPLSLLAAAFRLVMLAISGGNVLTMFAALVVLRDADYLPGPSRPALALLLLDLERYGYAIALAFFGMNCVVMAYLLVRSSHAPTALGRLLGLAGLGYLANSVSYLLLPGYTGSARAVLLLPALVAESWFCGWLLWHGGGTRAWAEP